MINIHYRQKYEIFGKHKPRIRHLDLLEIALHQPQTSITTVIQQWQCTPSDKSAGTKLRQCLYVLSDNNTQCVSRETAETRMQRLGKQTIDQFHKSQNAPVPYPTVLHSEQKYAHFCSEWGIVGYGTGVFWDLWSRSIPANTLRNNNVVSTSQRRHFDVITSKWRRFDVITTLLLRHVFRGM